MELRTISKAELQALADLKSILYGLRSERFGIELCVKLNYIVLEKSIIGICKAHTRYNWENNASRDDERNVLSVQRTPQGGKAGEDGRGGGRNRGRSGD
ncbi:hypothetical protein Tco_0382290 [Tanacetum coccineum]